MGHRSFVHSQPVRFMEISAIYGVRYSQVLLYSSVVISLYRTYDRIDRDSKTFDDSKTYEYQYQHRVW